MFDLSLLFSSSLKGLSALVGRRKALPVCDDAENAAVIWDLLSSTGDPFLARILELVEKNMSEVSFTAEVMAKELGYSRVQLHRLVLERLGMPPGRLLRELRMAKAAKMLQQRGMEVKTVAAAVGYAQVGNFSAAFHKHFGIAPSKFYEKMPEKIQGRKFGYSIEK